MITEPLKIWLAKYAGIGNCFSPSGITYKDPDGIEHTGSTGEVLNAFVVAHLVGKDSVQIIATVNYTQLKEINEDNDITITDVGFAYNNDGDPPGEPKYCLGECVPVWTCEIPPNGYEADGCGSRQVNPRCDPEEGDTDYAGTYEFIGPQEGDPTIILDLSELEMKQSFSDFHFEMNNITITSTSPIPIYVALEVRLFQGALNHCPESGEIFAGMDRVSTTRNVRIKLFDPGEVDNFNSDFYQPGAMRGVHTVCLIVHGTWTRTELENETALITG